MTNLRFFNRPQPQNRKFTKPTKQLKPPPTKQPKPPPTKQPIKQPKPPTKQPKPQQPKTATKPENSTKSKDDRQIIVFKGIGGIVHMLKGVVHAVKYKNGRQLIIDTHHHQGFRVRFGEIFTLKKGIKFRSDYQHLSNKKHIQVLDQWKTKPVKPEILTQPQPHKQLLIYSGNDGSYTDLLKHIQVRKDITRTFKTMPPKMKYIGVHFRNTDIQNDLNKMVSKIKKHPYQHVYLSTDDPTSINIFKKKLPNKKIVTMAHLPPPQTSKKSSSSYPNLHFLSDQQLGISKKQQIIEALQDIYNLKRSTVFIHSHKSGFSRVILYMRSTGKSIF